MSDTPVSNGSAATDDWTRLVPQPRNLTSAVYGSVLAASVIVGSGGTHGGFALALILIVTGLVFWLAHVYADTVASVHGGWRKGAIFKGLRHEWPLMFASVPPAVAAAAAALVPNLSPANGAWLALIVAILEQQAWGLAAVRRANLPRSDVARTVLFNLFVGAVIVALKLAVPGH